MFLKYLLLIPREWRKSKIIMSLNYRFSLFLRKQSQKEKLFINNKSQFFLNFFPFWFIIHQRRKIRETKLRKKRTSESNEELLLNFCCLSFGVTTKKMSLWFCDGFNIKQLKYVYYERLFILYGCLFLLFLMLPFHFLALQKWKLCINNNNKKKERKVSPWQFFDFKYC